MDRLVVVRANRFVIGEHKSFARVHRLVDRMYIRVTGVDRPVVNVNRLVRVDKPVARLDRIVVNVNKPVVRVADQLLGKIYLLLEWTNLLLGNTDLLG